MHSSIADHGNFYIKLLEMDFIAKQNSTSCWKIICLYTTLWGQRYSGDKNVRREKLWYHYGKLPQTPSSVEWSQCIVQNWHGDDIT